MKSAVNAVDMAAKLNQGIIPAILVPLSNGATDRHSAAKRQTLSSHLAKHSHLHISE
jgi:hypothetical protein